MALVTINRNSIATIIGLVLIVGLAGIYMFTKQERTRDVLRWQDQLNLVADGRARDVTKWVDSQFHALGEVADNPSLQIYFVTQQSQESERVAQGDYLHTLLVATANRLHFEPTAPSPEQEVKANVGKLDTGGLALLDRDGKLVMATRAMPPIEGELATIIAKAPRGKETLIDITADQQVGFIRPVYGIQGDRTAAGQIGMLVGIKPAHEIFALLNPEESAPIQWQASLVRKEGDTIRYLSPVGDQPALSQREQDQPAQQAAAYGVAQPGDFAERTDYTGRHVFVTGRAISGTPWTVLVTVDRDRALAESNAWRRTIAIIFGLMVVITATTLLAVWRHASARHSQQMAEELKARADLLSLVTNNQPEPLYIVDEAQRLWLANKAALKAMSSHEKDVAGKPLASVAGPAIAHMLQPYCKTALETHEPQTAMLERMDGTTFRTIHTLFVPVRNIPIDGATNNPGVLISEQDMTEIFSEREKRMLTLNQLIAMLVSLVDRRDPHAAQHSSCVALVASATAREMGLDADTVATTETAAQLMNLGKIDVPAELLVRKGALNEAERTAVRNSLSSSANLLEGIEFNGPVSETLRQAQEQVDGSGPKGLRGESILVSARIIAAANALVGMLSPRAYRQPLTADEAIKTLMGQVDTQFDRKVVVAMVSYLDNHGGRQKLERLFRKSQAA